MTTAKNKRVSIVSISMVKERSILYYGRVIASPQDGVDLVKQYLENSDREKLIVVGLDTKNQPTFIDTVSIGVLNTSLVHPREVFKSAILGNSASIVLFHNHPSGDIDPSEDDIEVTKRIADAGKLLGIPLVDHIIIGDDNFTSLRKLGLSEI